MPSSPSYTLVDQFDEDEFPDIPRAPAELLAALATVPDPRTAQGRRHPLPSWPSPRAPWWPARSRAVAATPAAFTNPGPHGQRRHRDHRV